MALSGQRMLGGGSTASVTLAGVAAQVISAGASATTVVAQSSGSTGVGDVQIVSDTGAVVTLSNGFDYKAAGVITTVSPPTGQVGTIVTITGTTLRGSADNVAQVTLANEAASITSEVDSGIRAADIAFTPSPSITMRWGST